MDSRSLPIDSAKWTGAAPVIRERPDELWDEAQDILNAACSEGLPGHDNYELTYERSMNAVMDAIARYKPSTEAAPNPHSLKGTER